MSDFFENYLDDTHRAVRANAQKFAEKEIAPHAYAWEEAGIFDRELYPRAAKAGVLGIGFPEEVGGEGGGALHTLMNIEGMMQGGSTRSEEHTSELQSRGHLVCRLLLEKKK